MKIVKNIQQIMLINIVIIGFMCAAPVPMGDCRPIIIGSRPVVPVLCDACSSHGLPLFPSSQKTACECSCPPVDGARFNNIESVDSVWFTYTKYRDGKTELLFKDRAINAEGCSAQGDNALICAVRSGDKGLVDALITAYRTQLKLLKRDDTQKEAVCCDSVKIEPVSTEKSESPEESEKHEKSVGLLDMPEDIIEKEIFARCGLSDLVALKQVCTVLSPIATRQLGQERAKRRGLFADFLNYTNHEGQTALVLAQAQGNIAIVELLRENLEHGF